MISIAQGLSKSYANSASGAFHVDYEDLIGAALLAAVQGRKMSYGIIDELRSMGGRDHRKLDKRTYQLGRDYDKEIPEPDYLVQLALRRCGVVMLDCLPKRLRKLLLLRYWHGLSHRDTAAEMDVSEARIFQLLHEAAALMRAELERRGIRSMRDVV